MTDYAKRDVNYVTTLLAVSSADGKTPVAVWADPVSHRVLMSGTMAILAATGAVNGVNAAFTFTQLPTVIVSDGAMYQQTNSAGQTVWSWNAGTLTATMTLAPQSDIFGIL